MKIHEQAGLQIAAYLSDPVQKLTLLIKLEGFRFVVCGTSGSGKTRAIDYANTLLSADQQIAESYDLLHQECPLKAIEIVEDSDLAYEDCRHIGFNVVRCDLARSLEESGVKVFWLDRGSSPRTPSTAPDDD